MSLVIDLDAKTGKRWWWVLRKINIVLHGNYSKKAIIVFLVNVELIPLDGGGKANTTGDEETSSAGGGETFSPGKENSPEFQCPQFHQSPHPNSDPILSQ